MYEFFNPNNHSSQMFTMGSWGHLGLLLGLVGATVAVLRIQPYLKAKEQWATMTAAAVLGLEALSYALKFIYPVEQAFERLPLHLCASMKIVLTLLVLFRRYDWVRYFGVLAVGCGFISFANLNMNGEGFQNFMFWHYVIGHAYLFIAPIVFIRSGTTSIDGTSHRQMQVGLAVWSFIIFLVNWAFDTNYMYTGPHNDTMVPFVPEVMRAWPNSYVSYVLIALVLLNATYLILRLTIAASRKKSAPASTVSSSSELLIARLAPSAASSSTQLD